MNNYILLVPTLEYFQAVANSEQSQHRIETACLDDITFDYISDFMRFKCLIEIFQPKE